jgi:glycosyltransferase involved in cell wall biosynthesis
MKVLVTTLARNEEKIIPYFIHHYSDIADKIVLIDHESTDKTVEVAKKVAEDTGVSLDVFTMRNDGYDEVMLKNVKENAYKSYRGDFDVVVVADADEFYHHPEGFREMLEGLLVKHKSFVIKPTGYQMVSKEFPEYVGKKLTDIITEGVFSEGFSKKGCFTTDLNISIAFGMHISEHYDSSNSKVEPLKDSGFMLLHYNYIGLDTRLESIKKTKNNLSKLGKEMLDHGINKQLAVSDDFLIEDFNSHYEKREEVNL